MSVYVDSYFAEFGRMQMSHMIADTLPELHEMADKIGVARRWFQGRARPCIKGDFYESLQDE